MKDKTLICADCGNQFVWTEGEQQFYADKGIDQPKYCLICRGRHQADQKFKSKFKK